jgi:hypothetical protein
MERDLGEISPENVDEIVQHLKTTVTIRYVVFLVK